MGLLRCSGGKLADGQPDQLKDGARVLAAAVADDPGDGVAEVEFADFFAERLDGLRQAQFGEGGGLANWRVTCCGPLRLSRYASSSSCSSGVNAMPRWFLMALPAR